MTGISNAQSFRGHSFRRGAASWAFRCGVPGEIIHLYGDWSSDAYKLYLEFSLESELTLANQLRQAIQSCVIVLFLAFFCILSGHGWFLAGFLVAERFISFDFP